MKFIFNKERVISGLQRAISIMPSKTGAALLRAVWLRAKDDSVTFISTDASVEFTGTYPAEIQEEGLIGVNGQIFYSLLNTCREDVKVQYSDDEGSLVILHKNGKCKIPVMESTWFQETKAFPEETKVLFSGSMLQEALDRVSFCVHDDPSSEFLNCLYINKRDNVIDICGLNGHLFGLYSFENDKLLELLPPEGILIQKNYLQHISKWMSKDEIEFSFTDKHVFFRNKNVNNEILCIPRSQYSFPDYLNFLNKVDSEGVSNLIIRKDELNDALNRMLTVNTDVQSCTDLYISEDGNSIDCFAKSENSGEVMEKIYIRYDGTIKRISFRTKELLSVLDHFDSKDVIMHITDEQGPCGFDGKNDQRYRIILMPVHTIESQYDEVESE